MPRAIWAATILLAAPTVTVATKRATDGRGSSFRGSKQRNQSGKPNLLFMMADQLRADAQGVDARFGGHLNTPNLDKLASEGLRFTTGFSSTPTCTPARAALLTGQSPWEHGMLGYGNVAKEYPFELPRALQSIGYSTTSIGKDHFGWNASDDRAPAVPQFDEGDKGSGTPHGFQKMSIYDGLVGQPDDYHQWFARQQPGKQAESCWPTLNMNGWMGAAFACDEYLHPTAWVGQQAVDWITNASATDPWFLKISFHRPHSPYDPPARVLNNISEDDLPVVQLAQDGWDSVFHGGPGYPSGCGPSDSAAWCGLMPKDQQQLGRRAYYANVAFIDEWVGKIMSALDARDFTERTYIIWTADHGDGQADHFHWRKGFPYQFSANVPFIFRWPDAHGPTAMARGTVIGDLVVELRDVLPTMLDAAGGMHTVPMNHTISGTSLLCLLKDPTGEQCTHTTPGESGPSSGKGWRKWLDLEHSTCYNETNHWSAIVDGRMKYIFNACPTCSFPAREQLFNLTADPGELHELQNDPNYAEELSKWRERMVAQFEAEGRGPEWVRDGQLQTRQSMTYGPNFPRNGPNPPGTYQCTNTSLTVGDSIDLEPNQNTGGTHICQDIEPTGSDQMAMQVAPKLCIVPNSDHIGATLMLASCSDTSLDQRWEIPGVDKKNQQVKHRASGLCLSAVVSLDKEHHTVQLASCTNTEAQLWILGKSGRLCLAEGCVSIVARNPALRTSFV